MGVTEASGPSEHVGFGPVRGQSPGMSRRGMSAQQDAETDNAGVGVELVRDPATGQLVLRQDSVTSNVIAALWRRVRRLLRG
jgi:hypothetical protein